MSSRSSRVVTSAPPRRQWPAKTMLLPLPRDKARDISLRYHTAFEALRLRKGSIHGISILLQMVILTGFIDDARRREIRAEALHYAESGLNASLDRGRQGGQWYLDPLVQDLVADLMTLHDRQMDSTPIVTLAQAMDRLERLRAQAVDSGPKEPDA